MRFVSRKPQHVEGYMCYFDLHIVGDHPTVGVSTINKVSEAFHLRSSIMPHTTDDFEKKKKTTPSTR